MPQPKKRSPPKFAKNSRGTTGTTGSISLSETGFLALSVICLLFSIYLRWNNHKSRSGNGSSIDNDDNNRDDATTKKKASTSEEDDNAAKSSSRETVKSTEKQQKSRPKGKKKQQKEKKLKRRCTKRPEPDCHLTLISSSGASLDTWMFWLPESLDAWMSTQKQPLEPLAQIGSSKELLS